VNHARRLVEDFKDHKGDEGILARELQTVLDQRDDAIEVCEEAVADADAAEARADTLERELEGYRFAPTYHQLEATYHQLEARESEWKAVNRRLSDVLDEREAELAEVKARADALEAALRIVRAWIHYGQGTESDAAEAMAEAMDEALAAHGKLTMQTVDVIVNEEKP
jgi:chromosome segregation ATPase